MTVYKLPTETDGTSFYSMSVPLDGTDFVCELRFNNRDLHWYLSVRDSEGTVLPGCEGQKLVAGWPPLRLARTVDKPLGTLLVTGPLTEDPGIENLGTDFELVYIPWVAPPVTPAVPA